MHFNPPIKGKPFDITSYYKNEMRSFVFVLTLWLFMARDALAAHYFLLGERFKHGTFMLVVYYILAYGLLPLLFVGPEVRNLFQQFDVDRLGGPHSWYFFYPSYTLEYGAAILPIALQVVLLAVLLWHGTRQYRQQITS
jgi:hypothetical protein